MTEEVQTYAAVLRGTRQEWSVPRLWRLAQDLPIVEMPVGEVSSCLDQDLWFNHGERPTTRAVARHCKQIIDADLKKPIILDQDGQVMDGIHRIAKAVLIGAARIRAVRFAKNPPPDSSATA